MACQAYRQRVLFGPSNPPVIDDVIPVRYIILEIIGKARWEGFMQADFQKHYGMDPRTSFHHIKNLIKLHLITKQVGIKEFLSSLLKLFLCIVSKVRLEAETGGDPLKFNSYYNYYNNNSV